MKSIEILKKINQYGAMLILTAPLWVSNSFIFPYVHLKNIFFRVLILLLSISLSWYLLEWRKHAVKKNYLLYIWGCFLLIQIVAAVFSFNAWHSWWGNWERMDGVINLILISLYFVLLSYVFRTRRSWLNLMRAALGAALLVGFYGLVKNGLNMANNQWSTLGNSAFLGFYMLLNLGIAVIAWSLDESRKWRWFYILVGIFLFFILLGAASRAPILGVLFGLLAGSLFYLPRAGKKFRIYFFSVLVLVLLVGGLAVANKNNSLVKEIHFLNRLAHISKTDATTHNRLLVWQSGWRAFKDKPILGWGPENFFYGVNRYYNSQITEDWFDRAHNFAVDYLVSSGVLGLLSYVAIWLTALYLIWRQRHRNYLLASVLTGWISAYLFSSLFIFDTINSWLLVIVVLAFIAWWVRLRDGELAMKEVAINWEKIYYPVLVLVVLGVVISIYLVAYKPARANYLTGKAYQYSEANPDKALDYYQQVWQLHTFGRREAVLQLLRYALSATQAPEVDLKTKKKIFNFAEQKVLTYLGKDPHNLQVRMILGELYLKYSQLNSFYIDEAINLLKIGIKDSPQRSDIYLMLAQAYSLKQDYKQAIYYLEQAHKVNSQSRLIYENLMNFYSRFSEQDKFIKLSREYLKLFKNLPAENYRKLGEYYFRLKMYRAAENILKEKAIPREPNNWRSYISLASLYIEQGQKQKAINFLETAVKQHPDFRRVVDEYLKTIK